MKTAFKTILDYAYCLRVLPIGFRTLLQPQLQEPRARCHWNVTRCQDCC